MSPFLTMFMKWFLPSARFKVSVASIYTLFCIASLNGLHRRINVPAVVKLLLFATDSKTVLLPVDDSTLNQKDSVKSLLPKEKFEVPLVEIS